MTQRGATEQTVAVTMEIPDGSDWKWMPQLNLVVLAPHLDEVGRQRAIDEALVTWRANWLSISA